MSASKWTLVFQGLSTLAVVSLAVLAVRREMKEPHSLLGLPPEGHRDRIRHLRPLVARARRSFEGRLERGDCSGALADIFQVSRLHSAISAHEDKTPAMGPSEGRMLAEWREACRPRFDRT